MKTETLNNQEMARPLRAHVRLVRVLIVSVVYLVLTLLLVRHLLPVATTHLFSDLGDPLLNASILEWNARHVLLTNDWWNFPAFAPLSGATAFTEHLLLTYPVASPIIWWTHNPVLAYNVVFILSWWLNAMAGYGLGRALTGSGYGGFVAGLAFAFAPYHAIHMGHVQLLLAFGMPMTLTGLHLYVANGRRAGLFMIPFGWLMAELSNAYTLTFFPLLIGLWLIWFVRRDNLGRASLALIALAVASVPLISLLSGYANRHAAYGFHRPYSDVLQFAADISRTFSVTFHNVLWGHVLPNALDESTLFPGLTITAMSAVALIVSMRAALDPPGAGSRATRRSVSRSLSIVGLAVFSIAALRLWIGPYSWKIGRIPLPPFEPSIVMPLALACLVLGALASEWMRCAWTTRNAAIFWSMSTLVFWFLALGPEPTIFRYPVVAYGPYRAFLALPFADEVRVPARAWQPATVCLAALAAYGSSIVIRTLATRRVAIAIFVSAAIIAEGWWTCDIIAAPSPMRSDLVPKDAMVLDLPVTDRVELNTTAQYRAVLAGYRVLNGYSGYLPEQHGELVQGTASRSDALLNAYRRLDDLFVILRFDDGRWIANQPGASLIAKGAGWDLYRLPFIGEIRSRIPRSLPSSYRPQSAFP